MKPEVGSWESPPPHTPPQCLSRGSPMPDTPGPHFNECSKEDCSSCLSSPSYHLTKLILNMSFPCSHLNPSCCSFIPSSFCHGHCHCPFLECLFPRMPKLHSTQEGEQELSRVSQPDSQRRCRSPSSLLPALQWLRPPCPACPTNRVLVACTPLPLHPHQPDLTSGCSEPLEEKHPAGTSVWPPEPPPNT